MQASETHLYSGRTDINGELKQRANGRTLQPICLEVHMLKEPKPSAPKNGERVRSTQHEGIFEVVFVNALMQSANIRLIDGSAHVVPNVPWTALTAIDKR